MNELLEIYRGTITGYNNDGTVRAAIDERTIAQQKQEFTVNLPLAWSGPNGEIMAGFPPVGAPVLMSRGHGGEWFITGYTTPNNTFPNRNSFGSGGLNNNKMSEFRGGRILLQTKKTKIGFTRLFIDPAEGIQAGTASSYLHADPTRNIFSHNFNEELMFTTGHRSIKGNIKRDIKQNILRDIAGSMLDSHDYSDSLYTVGMDPSNTTSFVTSGTNIRNLPLTENREVVYELANVANLSFTSDEEEAEAYKKLTTPTQPNIISRRGSRADAFSLSLAYPNHLLEIVKGTAVDSLSNILDLNRNVIPIGKKDDISFTKNQDPQETFRKVRALHRKSIAYHFELNARKDTNPDGISSPPNPTLKPGDANYDMGRNKSRFFCDIDKEGQIKINVPASSETGNIPLLTRYETASVRLAATNQDRNPNEFVKDKSGTDLFLESFANFSPIVLDGDSVPVDFFTEKAIGYGTAFHDITKTCLQFQDTGRDSLVSYLPNSRLNDLSPIDPVVSSTIKISGDGANAGGRSGNLNFDGFLSFSVGANTIDRQSMWWDFAGGVLANYGRDLKNRSYMGSFDGDVLVQIGGVSTVANDSRFSNINNGVRSGVLDIRIVDEFGQLLIIRGDSRGLVISSPGRIEFNSAQDIIFNTRGAIKMHSEEVIVFHESDLRRRILRNGKEM